MSDGTRTHDHLDHNQGLYQLSYAHHVGVSRLPASACAQQSLAYRVAGYHVSMPAASIETDRLLLRRWRAADRVPFAALNADPVVMEHFPGTLTREESDAFADVIDRHFDEHGFGLWAVEVVDGSDLAGEMIGFVGLKVQTFEAAFTPCVEIGWRLSRAAWGTGYATEAARASLRFGFGQAGLDEVLSWTTPDNVRSTAVMQRIGMVRAPELDFHHPKLEPTSPLSRHVVYRATPSSSTP